MHVHFFLRYFRRTATRNYVIQDEIRSTLL